MYCNHRVCLNKIEKAIKNREERIMKIKILVAGLSLGMVLTLGACQQTDIVGKVASTSFDALLKAAPNKAVADNENGGWSLNAPDDSVKFIWSKDWSKSPTQDAMIIFQSKPFIDAGLDVSKLSNATVLNDTIVVGTKFGTEELKYDGEVTPLESFNQIVKLKRESIGYHEELDHYGIDLTKGNKFEWAKDMTKNDKDMVFVIDAKTLIAAGVDLTKVKGWNYGNPKVKDNRGKEVEVEMFWKSFDIE